MKTRSKSSPSSCILCILSFSWTSLLKSTWIWHVCAGSMWIYVSTCERSTRKRIWNVRRTNNSLVLTANHSMLRWTRHLAPADQQALQQVPSPPGLPLRQVCQQLPQLQYADKSNWHGNNCPTESILIVLAANAAHRYHCHRHSVWFLTTWPSCTLRIRFCTKVSAAAAVGCRPAPCVASDGKIKWICNEHSYGFSKLENWLTMIAAYRDTKRHRLWSSC